MQFTTTISQKGQIVVPKKIRDLLNLKPADILVISIKNDAIVAKPVSSTNEIFGMFKPKKIITKKNIKNSFQKAVLEKKK